MAVYSQMVLTTQGQALYAKAQSGTTLNFTRMQIGGGQLASGHDPSSLTALITPIAYFNINSESTSGNVATIKGIFENTSITTSTYTCELGLFAQDPTAGEILYAYANAGTQGDLIPPISVGQLSKLFQINVTVGNAANVTANLPSVTYVTTLEMGVSGGVATLDNDGQVPANQLKNTLGANTFTGIQAAPAFASSGLTGATAPSRYVGATTSGAPTNGTFSLGDYIIDQTGSIWVCTASGTPGTWSNSFLPAVSGSFTFSSGQLNVSAGTPINIATLPYVGYTTFELVVATGGGAGIGAGVSFRGITTPSGATIFSGYTNTSAGIYKSAYLTALSSTTVNGFTGAQMVPYDGTYSTTGYFQINGNKLQFVPTVAATASTGTAWPFYYIIH